jgi:hypothetical protein
MLYISESSKYFSVFKNESVQVPSQKKADPLFPSGRPSDTSGRPLVSRRFSMLQRTSVRTTGKNCPNPSQSSRIIWISFADTDIGR